MIKRIKDRMISLGLSVKKESLILIILNVLTLSAGLVLTVLLKNLLLIVFTLSIILLINFGFYYRIVLLEQKRYQEDLDDFVEVFTFLKIYLSNSYNVYNALSEVSKFANTSLKIKIERLLQEIDNDKTVEPFINFSRNFKELLVEQIMVALYEIIDNGYEQSTLLNFETILDKFSDTVHDRQLENKDKKLGSLAITPLIGSAILILMVTFGIISIVGELTNVL